MEFAMEFTEALVEGASDIELAYILLKFNSEEEMGKDGLALVLKEVEKRYKAKQTKSHTN